MKQPDEIAAAVAMLKRGGLVAFPTETVYGLGADARNPEAVAKIFAAKGRPAGNPLIVHVSDALIARRYLREWPESAAQLTQQFWPGPLTIVLPQNNLLAPAVSAGRDSVGVRAPHHLLALELLRAFDGPMAGPSANRSMHVSPTTAAHVRADLGGKVDLILDGGPCTVGIESTVLDLSQRQPMILRPGAITRTQIEAVIGPVAQFTGHIDVNQAARSPGLHARHYSPHKPAYRFEPPERKRLLQALSNRSNHAAMLTIAPLAVGESAPARVKVAPMPVAPVEYAAALYAALRIADEGEVDELWVEMPPALPEWDAIRDRLIRATRACHEISIL